MTAFRRVSRALRPGLLRAAAPLALSLLCGYVDAFGLVSMTAFLSFMSGNTVFTGVGIGTGSLVGVLVPATAVAGFCAGAFGGTILHAGRPNGHGRGLAVSAALLALAWCALRLDLGLPYVSLVLVAASMGIVNAVWKRIGNQTVNVAFVTGALFTLCAHLAQAVMCQPVPDQTGPEDTHLRRARLLAAQVILFLTGAIVGAWATSRIGADALLLPLGMLVVLAVRQRPSLPGAQ